MSKTGKQFEPSKIDIVWCADRVDQGKDGKSIFIINDRRKFHLVRIALSSILSMSGHKVTTFAETTENQKGEIIHSYTFVSDMPYSEYLESQMIFENG